MQKRGKYMKKPIHFLILKLVGFIGIITAIVGAIVAFRGFNDFESNNFLIGGFFAALGLMIGFVGFTTGFAPEIAKIKAKSVRYIQEETKDNLTAIASNTADIMSDAVTTTVRAVSDGVRKNTFCKHCGAKIDSDSTFCSSCGKEL